MNSKKLLFLFTCALTVFFLSAQMPAKEKDGNKKSQGLKKTQGVPPRTFLDINNITTVIKNDGISDIDKNEANSGLVFPAGSGKTAVYESGLLWGVRIEGDPQVRVGGSAYRSGLQPGKILSPGNPEDPDLDKNRIYRVRPDVYPGGPAVDLSREVRDEGGTSDAIRAQYEKDWMEWPVADGAPYDDKNNNGKYDPSVDIPGVPGANQTIWYVANDLNPGKTSNLYGTQPVGMEMQATFWAYSQTGALGNMYFRKYKLINKSSNIFHDTYLSMWSDVDLGNATDDFAGCDTTLSLGFCYNANAIDATYDPLPPPAVGFDFFQGPILKGIAGEDRNKNGVDDSQDNAIFDGRVLGPGYINLPMTSFYYFARGDASVTDPTQGDPQGSTQFYNFFQGKIGLSGEYFTDPNTLEKTTFALSGDPQTRKGWIDGQLIGSGDRRMGMASGPFEMAPGDTQEVVVAEIVAGAIPGTDRLSAIGLLKFYDQQAQLAYDNFFDLPTPPPAPEINAVELDKSIVLDWGENMSAVDETENSDAKGYKFQGYNVYQLPSASATISEAKRIATYDINDGIGKIEDKYFDASTGVVAVGVRQFGNDTGIKRYLNIKTDELNGGTPLINGIKYYYAVTAYNFNPDPNAVPNNLENPIKILTLIPHSPDPGVRYQYASGDSIAVSHSAGISDGAVVGIVVDPTRLTGDDYRVTFDSSGTKWTLTDVTAGNVLLANQTNLSGDDNYSTVDGIFLKVMGPQPGFKDDGGGIVEINYAGTPLTADEMDGAGTPYGGNSVWHSLNSNSTYYLSAGGGDGDFDRLLRFADYLNGRDFEIRFTDGPNYGVKAFSTDTIISVPFELWDIGSGTPDDPSDDKRMIPFISENAPGFNSLQFSGDTDPYYSFPASDWIYWMDPEGTDGYDKFAQACQQAGGAGGLYPVATDGSTDGYWADFHGDFFYPIGRMIFCDYDANGQFPPSGTIIRMVGNKPITSADQFTFTSPAPSADNTLAVDDVKSIKVFPNPYYGVNSEELNKYNRFVTFSHLPAKAKIRIFNLAGILVKTIDKNSNTQFQRWDLANQSGLPVASGLYIAYIEMPDLGATKILKIAVIQEEQILDRF